MLLFAWTEPYFQEVLGSSGGGLLTGALSETSSPTNRLTPFRGEYTPYLSDIQRFTR